MVTLVFHLFPQVMRFRLKKMLELQMHLQNLAKLQAMAKSIPVKSVAVPDVPPGIIA